MILKDLFATDFRFFSLDNFTDSFNGSVQLYQFNIINNSAGSLYNTFKTQDTFSRNNLSCSTNCLYPISTNFDRIETEIIDE